MENSHNDFSYVLSSRHFNIFFCNEKKYKKTLAILSANCYLNRVRRDRYKNVVISTFTEVRVYENSYTGVRKNRHLINVNNIEQKKARGISPCLK